VIIGLISDTHGLLRPEAIAALEASDHLIHAGDVGNAEVLEALARIAPLTAIRGNNDTQPWARGLSETETIDLAGVCIHVIHDLAALPPRPGERDIRVVISGHSHVPRIEEREGVLYVNPGSAGPRRFTLPVSVAHLAIEDGAVSARLQELRVGTAGGRAMHRGKA
jgi:putative phosphoesterase